jgi:hypothetical protein
LFAVLLSLLLLVGISAVVLESPEPAWTVQANQLNLRLPDDGTPLELADHGFRITCEAMERTAGRSSARITVLSEERVVVTRMINTAKDITFEHNGRTYRIHLGIAGGEEALDRGRDLGAPGKGAFYVVLRW